MEIICINIRSTHQQLSNQGSNISYSRSYVSEEKYFGQKSLKVKVNTAGEDSRCGVRQTTGNNVLVPGKTYTLSAYVKTSNILKGTDVGALIGVKTEFAVGTVFIGIIVKLSYEKTTSGLGLYPQVAKKGNLDLFVFSAFNADVNNDC